MTIRLKAAPLRQVPANKVAHKDVKQLENFEKSKRQLNDLSQTHGEASQTRRAVDQSQEAGVRVYRSCTSADLKSRTFAHLAQTRGVATQTRGAEVQTRAAGVRGHKKQL